MQFEGQKMANRPSISEDFELKDKLGKGRLK